MKHTPSILTVLITLVLGTSLAPMAPAQLYWDINGTNGGASDGGDATGNWTSSSTTWNTDSNGTAATQPWVADSVAVLSAGGSSGYTVTITDAESASGITFADNTATLASSGSGQLTLTGAATVDVPSSSAVGTITATIGGSVGLSSTGLGVLELGGANVYTGPTTVGVANTVKLTAAGAIPDASVLTITAGSAVTSFLLNGFDETVKSVTTTGTGASGTIALGTKTLTLADDGETQIYNGLFSSTAGGRVVKNGTGSLTLNGQSGSFVGGEFVVNSGNVGVGAVNVFGQNNNNSKLTMNGGQLTTITNLSMNTQFVDIGGSFALNINTSGNLQFIGNQGTGVVTLKASNPTITVNLDSTTTRLAIPNPNAPTAINGTVVLASKIQDDGTPRGFTKSGEGILTLANPDNSYTGDTTILQGILRLSKQVGNNATVGDGKAGTGRINLSGGTLNYNGSINPGDTVRTLTVANPIRVTADSALSYISTTLNLAGLNDVNFVFTNDDISGTGGTLTLKNDGVCTSNSNSCVFRPTFTGTGFDFNRPVAINNQITDATTGRLASRSTVLQSANTFGTQTWSGAISGTGILRRSAAGGTTVLSGANTYTGGTIVDGGTLTAAGSSATFGSGDVTVNTGNAAISAGVSNAILNTAKLTLLGGGTAGVADTGFMNLGAGINEIIGSLVLGAVTQPSGTYGSSLSSATFKLDEYFAGAGILTISPAGVPGDYNGNGIVDSADYVLWRNGGPLLNEVDAPGTVNAADYTAWRARFGNTSGSGSSLGSTAAVPEPGSLALLALAGLIVSAAGGTFGRAKR